MFGIGGFELFIIVIFGFLIFGPDKLPDIARTVGKGIARFREVQKDVNDAIGNEKLVDLNDPNEPIKNPVEVLDRVAARQADKKAKASGVKVAKGEATPSTSATARAAKDVDTSASAAADGSAEADESAVRSETFTERKARYEKERAARKATEQKPSSSAPAQSAPAKSTPSKSESEPAKPKTEEVEEVVEVAVIEEGSGE